MTPQSVLRDGAIVVGVILWLGCVALIVGVVAHFVTKYW